MLFFRYRFREESRSLRSWSIALGLTTIGVTITAMSLDGLRENIALFKEALTRLPAVMKMVGGSLALLDPAILVVGTILNTLAPVFSWPIRLLPRSASTRARPPRAAWSSSSPSHSRG